MSRLMEEVESLFWVTAFAVQALIGLHKISGLRKDMEDYYNEHCNYYSIFMKKGIPTTAEYLFGSSQEPMREMREMRKGRKRKEPTLNVYQTCLYLRHLLNAEQVESGILGYNQAEDARILSAMCGGERSGFDTALKNTFNAFWVAKDDKEKQNEISMQIEEIKGIINRKEE